jgi:lipid-A-disaccharide synthase
MVITYRMPALSWWLMKRKRYQPYAGLPNILCERFVVPELMQEDATPENLTQALLNLVNDKNAVAQLEQTFTELHLSLRQNTAQKAAAAILPYLPTT